MYFFANFKCSSINNCRRKKLSKEIMEAIKIIIKSNRQAKLNKRSISRMHTFPNLLKYSVSHACIYYSSVELCRLVRFICLWNNNRTPTEFEWKHNRSVDTVTEQRTRYTRNHGSIAGWYKKFHPSPKYPYRFCGSTSQLPGALFPGKKKKKKKKKNTQDVKLTSHPIVSWG